METVMIVDDAKVMRNIIKEILDKSSKYRFLEASTGEEAVELYKKEKPNCVTMDISMDEKSGVDAAKEILEFDKNAKIVMVTALGQDRLLRECVRLGVCDYIVKPFSKERLIASIDKTLGN